MEGEDTGKGCPQRAVACKLAEGEGDKSTTQQARIKDNIQFAVLLLPPKLPPIHLALKSFIRRRSEQCGSTLQEKTPSCNHNRACKWLSQAYGRLSPMTPEQKPFGALGGRLQREYAA